MIVRIPDFDVHLIYNILVIDQFKINKLTSSMSYDVDFFNNVEIQKSYPKSM